MYIVPHISQNYVVPHPSSVQVSPQDGKLLLPPNNNNRPSENIFALNRLNPSFSVSSAWDGTSVTGTNTTDSELTDVTNLMPSLNNNTLSLGLYDPTKDPRHVAAVYSMWSHFLDFCASDINTAVKEPRYVPSTDDASASSPFNAHTGGKRLKLFVNLSLGKST